MTDSRQLARGQLREQSLGPHQVGRWTVLHHAPVGDDDDAIRTLEAHGVPCAPVLSVAETMREPHLRERGTVRTVTDRLAGSFEVPGFPLRFSDFPDPLPLEAPLLGEHNAEVLTSMLGKSPAEVERLRAAGVLIEKAC